MSLGGGGVRHAAPLGLACAAGAITFFAAIGGMIAAVGGGLAPYLIAAKPIVALIIIGLGIVQLLDVRPGVLGEPADREPSCAVHACTPFDKVLESGVTTEFIVLRDRQGGP